MRPAKSPSWSNNKKKQKCGLTQSRVDNLWENCAL